MHGQDRLGRVFLGGLVAGIVINLSETLLNTVVLKDDWAEAIRALGKDPAAAMAGNAMTIWILWRFLVGIGIVWVYAAIRPRFGPGARTAVISGIGAWYFAGFLPDLAMMNMGLFPRKLVMIGLGWGLVEYIIAAVAGGWVYREA